MPRNHRIYVLLPPMSANIDSILQKVKCYVAPGDLPLIRRAHDYATVKHSGVLRKTGEPYMKHSIERDSSHKRFRVATGRTARLEARHGGVFAEMEQVRRGVRHSVFYPHGGRVALPQDHE